jgi:hypothetical protein
MPSIIFQNRATSVPPVTGRQSAPGPRRLHDRGSNCYVCGAVARSCNQVSGHGHVIRGGVDITLVDHSPFVHAPPHYGVQPHANLDPLGCGDPSSVGSGNSEGDVVSVCGCGRTRQEWGIGNGASRTAGSQVRTFSCDAPELVLSRLPLCQFFC